MSIELQQEVAALRARRDGLLTELLQYVPERERAGMSLAALSERRDYYLCRVPRDFFDRVLRAEYDLNAAARRAVLADPCVRAALDVFGAEVVEVRVRVGEGGACMVEEGGGAAAEAGGQGGEGEGEGGGRRWAVKNEDVRKVVEGLAEALGAAVLQWGLGDLSEARNSLRDLQNKAAAAVAMVDGALGSGPSVVISVNGCAVAVPSANTRGITIKAYAERQAGIPRHRNLYRGGQKVGNDEVLTVESGEEFTMRGAL